MPDWRALRALPGVSDVEQIVAVFEVRTTRVPHGRFKVKILERSRGGYLGFANVSVRDPSDGTDVGLAGHGVGPDEALADTIRGLFGLVAEMGATGETDFAWSDSDDF